MFLCVAYMLITSAYGARFGSMSILWKGWYIIYTIFDKGINQPLKYTVFICCAIAPALNTLYKKGSLTTLFARVFNTSINDKLMYNYKHRYNLS